MCVLKSHKQLISGYVDNPVALVFDIETGKQATFLKYPSQSHVNLQVNRILNQDSMIITGHEDHFIRVIDYQSSILRFKKIRLLKASRLILTQSPDSPFTIIS